MEKYLSAMLERGMKKSGALQVTFPSGDVKVFGDGSDPVAKIRLTDTAAVRAAWFDPNLQFAELYMDGRLIVEEGSLYDFMALAKANGAKKLRLSRRRRTRSGPHDPPQTAPPRPARNRQGQCRASL